MSVLLYFMFKGSNSMSEGLKMTRAGKLEACLVLVSCG